MRASAASATALLSRSVLHQRSSAEHQIHSMSRLATSNGRTSRCGCRCAVYSRNQCVSKKLENHASTCTLYVLQVRPPHQTLRITPPTEAGVSDHVWSVEKSSSCVSNREQAYAVSATSDPSIHHHRSGGARVTICRGLGQSFTDGPSPLKLTRYPSVSDHWTPIGAGPHSCSGI